VEGRRGGSTCTVFYSLYICRATQTIDYGQLTMDMTYLSCPTANGLEALLVLFKRSLERQDAHQRTLHPMWLGLYLYYTATGSKACLHLNRMDAKEGRKQRVSSCRPVFSPWDGRR
jgi:hypothetical protein